MFELDHIDIAVDDVSTHLSFYESLGFKILAVKDHEGQSAELLIPGKADAVLELTPTRRTDGRHFPAGLRHMAFRCDDIARLHRHLQERGVSLGGAPRIIQGRLLFNAIDPSGKSSVQFVEGG